MTTTPDTFRETTTATEYRAPSGRCIQVQAKGEGARQMLVRHEEERLKAEGRQP